MKNYGKIILLRLFPVVFFALLTTSYGYSQNCIDIELDAETIIISQDTTLHCDSFFQHFLICEGVTVNFIDNSCFNTFYLEPGSNLIYDSNSYGYSEIYASAGSTVHANFTQIQSIHYEVGAHLIDTLSPFSPYDLYECPLMSFDYSLSGNCSQNDCEDILLDAETIIISQDTTIHCDNFHQHFLICEGITVIYFDWDNSCFDTFYLESNSTLIYDPNSFGAMVYASSGSTVYANFSHIQNIYYEVGAHLIDTLSPHSPYHLYECQYMSFDYSLSGSCTTTGLENKKSSSVLIYPNPAKDFINIESEQNIEQITIYNVAGEVVYEKSLSTNLINVSNIKPGKYFLIVSFDNGTSAIKRFATY